MDENKLMVQFLSELLGTNDPKKILNYLKGLDELKLKALATKYQQWKEAKKKKLATKAAHGAKLNYIKTLKHICPEGLEVYYYKKGGNLECGCRGKKMEDGGKTKVKNSVEKFKDQAARDSFYINVHGAEDLESTRPGSYKKNKEGKILWTPDRTKAPYNNNRREEPLEPKKTIKQKVNNKKDLKDLKEKEKSPRFKTMAMTKKGGSIVDKFKSAKCGSKMKKK